jgi:hypothetical protein
MGQNPQNRFQRALDHCSGILSSNDSLEPNLNTHDFIEDSNYHSYSVAETSTVNGNGNVISRGKYHSVAPESLILSPRGDQVHYEQDSSGYISNDSIPSRYASKKWSSRQDSSETHSSDLLRGASFPPRHLDSAHAPPNPSYMNKYGQHMDPSTGTIESDPLFPLQTPPTAVAPAVSRGRGNDQSSSSTSLSGVSHPIFNSEETPSAYVSNSSVTSSRYASQLHQPTRTDSFRPQHGSEIVSNLDMSESVSDARYLNKYGHHMNISARAIGSDPLLHHPLKNVGAPSGECHSSITPPVNSPRGGPESVDQSVYPSNTSVPSRYASLQDRSPRYDPPDVHRPGANQPISFHQGVSFPPRHLDSAHAPPNPSYMNKYGQHMDPSTGAIESDSPLLPNSRTHFEPDHDLGYASSESVPTGKYASHQNHQSHPEHTTALSVSAPRYMNKYSHNTGAFEYDPLLHPHPTSTGKSTQGPFDDAVNRSELEVDPSGYGSSDSVPTGKYASRQNQIPQGVHTQGSKRPVNPTPLPNDDSTLATVELLPQIQRPPLDSDTHPPKSTISHASVDSGGTKLQISKVRTRGSGAESTTAKKSDPKIDSQDEPPLPSGKYANKNSQTSMTSTSTACSDVRSRIQAFEQKSQNSPQQQTTKSPLPLLKLASFSRTKSPNTNFVSPSKNIEESDEEMTTSPITIPIEPKHSARKTRKGSPPVADDMDSSDFTDTMSSALHLSTQKTEKNLRKKNKYHKTSSEESQLSGQQKIQLVTQELEKMFTDNDSSSNKKHQPRRTSTKSANSSAGHAIGSSSHTPTPPPPSCSNLTTAEKKLTSIYFKMKSLGIPFPSIIQKMTLDGLPIELQEKIRLEMSSKTTPLATGEVSTHHQGNGGNTSATKSNDEGEGGSGGVVNGEDLRRNLTLLTKTKLQKLHWKPFNITHLSASSLWCKSNPLIHELFNEEPDEQEIKQLEQLFGIPSLPLPHTSTTTTDTSSGRTHQTHTTTNTKHSHGRNNHNNSSSSTHHLPQVLDIQRATNISIGLVHFKEFGSIRNILNSICSLDDLHGRLTSDKLLNFSNMLPTLDELKLLQNLPHTNNKAELFCKIVIEYYPYLPSRLHSFLTIKQYQEMSQKILPKILLYFELIQKILQSEHFIVMMNKMLMIGNILNAGTSMGHAKGFSLYSLNKMITMKAHGTYGGEEDHGTTRTGVGGEGTSVKKGEEEKGKKALFQSSNGRHTSAAGGSKKISLVEYTVQSLKSKGFPNILELVNELKSVDEVTRINLGSLYHEIDEMLQEYDFLTEQLQISNDYLLFYYQDALEAWKASTNSNMSVTTPYQIRVNDSVQTPYGPGTVIEINTATPTSTPRSTPRAASGMLKIRPIKWHLQNEVCHNFYVQATQCTVRPPFEIGETVITHHGPGVVMELRAIDNIAIIKPLTWMKSSFHLPLIYEPIVSLRPYSDPATGDQSHQSSGVLVPKLTRLYTHHLQQFLSSHKASDQQLRKLSSELKSKCKEFLLYFNESESGDNHTSINELMEIIKNFRSVLVPLYTEEQNRIKRELYQKQKLDKANELKAAAAAAAIAPPPDVPVPIPTPVAVSKVNPNPVSNNSVTIKPSTVAKKTTPAQKVETQSQVKAIPKKFPAATSSSKVEPKGVISKESLKKQITPEPKVTSSIPTKGAGPSRQYVNVFSSSSDSDTESVSRDSTGSDDSDYELWLEQYSNDQKTQASPPQKSLSHHSGSLSDPVVMAPEIESMSWRTNDQFSFPLDTKPKEGDDSHLVYLNHMQSYIQYLNSNLSEMTNSVAVAAADVQTLSLPSLSTSIQSLQQEKGEDEEEDKERPHRLQRFKQEFGEKYKGFSFSGDVDELLHRKEIFGKDSLTSIELEAIDYYMTHYNELMEMKKQESSRPSQATLSSHHYYHFEDSSSHIRDDQLNHFDFTNFQYSNPSGETTTFSSSSFFEQTALTLTNKFSGFSFADNIEDLLQRRAKEGTDSLTSFEIEALEFYDQQHADRPERHRDTLKTYSDNHLEEQQTFHHTRNVHETPLSEEEDDEEDGIADPTVLAIRAAQALMRRTMSLLKDDDEDEATSYANEVMERLERERVEEARRIMERIEHEIESTVGGEGDGESLEKSDETKIGEIDDLNFPPMVTEDQRNDIHQQDSDSVSVPEKSHPHQLESSD